MKQIVEPLMEWYEQHARNLPWRENPDPYHVWLSEIMLQQTRVEAVKEYYVRFLQELPTVRHLAEVPQERLMKLWQGLGYYNRARNLQKAAKILWEEYGGEFPTSYEQWLALPGVGAYTAGAVTSIAFGVKQPAVDGNVYRIYTRLQADDTPIQVPAFQKKVQKVIREILPEEAGTFNQALMDLGAMVCIPGGKPHCNQCPLEHLCQARALGKMLSYPVKQPKKKRDIQKKTIFVIEYQGKYLIAKRPEKGLLAGMWEFPSYEGMISMQALQSYIQDWNLKREVCLLGKTKHIFTHVEWHMLGYEIHLEQLPEEIKEQGFFCDKKTLLEKYSIPAAYHFYMKQAGIV